ncbi:MAG: ferritin-like domain-containing protein [Polyangiaceae bacterium]|nr:ferritin-like domain-containing protein [Polyangiaceae bacterium]
MGEATFVAGQCCYEVHDSCCVGSGRPFLIANRLRTAELRVAPGIGWTSTDRPCVEALAPAVRAFLAEAWLRDALLEHASVASFSRFALELLAVGAPSDLVDAAHQAASDEVRHARACFSLASAYAGAELGPGPFAFGGPIELGSDLAAVAASAVKEGCVGETLAAVQASVQLDGARDPAVQKALEEIAEDEARHADLAWRFVAWAVRVGGAQVVQAVAAAFEEALAGVAPSMAEPEVDAALVVAHGRATSEVLRVVFAETVEETIRPAMRLLVGEAGAPTRRRADVSSEACREHVS